MSSLNKFISVFEKPDFKKLYLIILGMVGLGILEILSISSIFPFMAVVTTPSLIQENYYLNFAYHFFSFSSNEDFLVWSGFSVIFLLALTNIYSIFVNWTIINFVSTQSHSIASKLFKSYLEQPYAFFLNRNSNDLSKNILTEVSRSVSGVILPGLTALARLIVIFCLFGLLLFINYIVAFGIFIILGGSYIFIYSVVKNTLNQRGEATTEATRYRYKYTNEAIYGVKDLKLRGSEASYLKKFMKFDKAFYHNTAIANIITLLPRFILEIITFGGIVAIVILLIMSGKTGSEIIPVLSLYALAGYRLMPALQQVYAGFSHVKYFSPALNIIVDDYDSLKSDFYKIKSDDIIEFNNSIKLNSVNFAYPGATKPILNNLNIKIKHNTTVGLVGSSGSGKTTLVDILLGLLSLEKGEYLVDDFAINKSNISSWQKRFGYVSQDIFLADDSVEHNIAFSIPYNEIDHEQVKKAAKLANIHEFIESMPDGYKTYTGDRGVRLSGGQKQRIGIARALYFSPDILVLDEATSALDGSSENVIMEAINNLSKNKTIVIIAHRLQTVKDCDVIHFLEYGNIVDSGSYHELLETNENFRKMANKDSI
jgi:ATP-binding cassette, subfamily B, bacterial PglK